MTIVLNRVAIKFDIGRVMLTHGAFERVHQEDLFDSFLRHIEGDWGELCDEDRHANELACEFGGRIMSRYSDRNEIWFWIITEADRSATTLLLPNEY